MIVFRRQLRKTSFDNVSVEDQIKVHETLTKARAHIEEVGSAQHTFENRHGSKCMMGAINWAVSSTVIPIDSSGVALGGIGLITCRLLAESLDGKMSPHPIGKIISYNDFKLDKKNHKQSVLDAFDRARSLAAYRTGGTYGAIPLWKDTHQPAPTQNDMGLAAGPGQ